MPRKPQPRTADVLEAFLATRAAKGCSPRTLEWYRYTVGHLVRAEPILPTTPEPIERVLATLGSRSPSTRADVWSGMRALYRWASQRLLLPDAMAQVARRRPPTTQTRSLNQIETEQLLFANQRHDLPFAVIHFILDSGARVGELQGLTWHDIDSNQ